MTKIRCTYDWNVSYQMEMGFYTQQIKIFHFYLIMTNMVNVSITFFWVWWNSYKSCYYNVTKQDKKIYIHTPLAVFATHPPGCVCYTPPWLCLLHTSLAVFATHSKYTSEPTSYLSAISWNWCSTFCFSLRISFCLDTQSSTVCFRCDISFSYKECSQELFFVQVLLYI